MNRRLLAAVALFALAGCQDYNFNPVGKCIIQPGSARIRLDSVSTADILFVVDDSGSMFSEQKRLADNFGAFIGALATMQKARTANGLDPLEFHIAITTSSVFEAYQALAPSGGSAPVCGQPTPGACSITAPYESWKSPYDYQCTTGGAACVDLIDQYWPGCSAGQYGQGQKGQPYPAGNFMAAPSVASPSNPRVLHFTKDLAWDTWGTSAVDPAITTLMTQFQQNIAVGACGSGMEQHLQGGRLAVQKALANQQPGIATGEWPHPGAKLVVVWVGDEDDCSNPKDPNRSLAFTPWTTQTTDPNPPGHDACMADEAAAAAGQPYKMFPVQEFVDYFVGLDRPFGAAFIYSTPPTSCAPDANGNTVCQPGYCTCTCPADCASCTEAAEGAAPGHCEYAFQCGGRSTGTRFHDASAGLRASSGKVPGGVQTFEGSVCDWDFAKTLQQIAELATPPAGLTLPSQPAATDVTMLRIQSADGKNARLCNGPGPGLDWQFVDCKTGVAMPQGATSLCITINHTTGHCEANPGETYIAQYLGMVPPGGCAAEIDCAQALGGAQTDWTCQKTPGQARGTCICANPTP
jgi:hypothetical protein